MFCPEHLNDSTHVHDACEYFFCYNANMTERKLVVRRVKPDKLQDISDWCDVLSKERSEEVIDSLRAENVSREFAYTVPLGDGHLFIGFMESDKENDKGILDASSDLKINKDHNQKLYDCLEFGEIGKELYYFAK